MQAEGSPILQVRSPQALVPRSKAPLEQLLPAAADPLEVVELPVLALPTIAAAAAAQPTEAAAPGEVAQPDEAAHLAEAA
jgi:hypothetical protein